MHSTDGEPAFVKGSLAGAVGRVCPMGMELQLEGDEKVLEVDSDSGGTTM